MGTEKSPRLPAELQYLAMHIILISSTFLGMCLENTHH